MTQDTTDPVRRMVDTAKMYDTPAEYLYYSIMKGCGCGNGSEIAEKAWELFEAIALRQVDESDQTHELIYKDMYHETITQWFDSLGLIEHGGSVGSSWLSDKGKELYNFLSMHYKKNPWIGYDKQALEDTIKALQAKK